MELGSVAHKYFLMNLRLPVNDTMNVGIGEIKDIHVVVSIISTCSVIRHVVFELISKAKNLAL